MPARRAAEVAARFQDQLQDAVACVAKSVLVHRQDPGGSLHKLLLEPEPRVQTETGRLELRVKHSYQVVPDPDGDYRISTASYFYDASELLEYDARRQILGYHWNSGASGNDPKFPHLHVYSNRQIGDKDLSKIHLPTGRVSLESFVHLLITELGVHPLREDWESVLEGRKATLLHHPRT